MSPPARELSITYGSYTVSPDGNWRFDQGFDAFTLEFSFIITGTTESAFDTNCKAAVTAFRKPFQDLTVTLGSTSQSFKPSANTGLETRSTIIKEGHVLDTARTRRYTVRITGGCPADNVATAGLREFSVNVAFAPSKRRTVTISGVFTAQASTAARATYIAAIDGICNTVLNGLSPSLTVGTNCQLISEDPTASSYNDKTLSFTRQYHETIYPQATPNVVEQHLRISVTEHSERNAPGHGAITSTPSGDVQGTPTPVATPAVGSARPFDELTANYDAYIDKTKSTSPTTEWTSIYSWIVDIMKALGAGKFAVVSRTMAPTYDDNQINGTVSAIRVPQGISVIRHTLVNSVQDAKGRVFIPTWGGADTSCFTYQGPRVYTETIREMVESVSGGTAAGGGGGGGSSANSSGSGSSVFGFGGGSFLPFGNLFQGGSFTPFGDIGSFNALPSGSSSFGGWNFEAGIGPNSGQGTSLDNNGPNSGGGSDPSGGVPSDAGSGGSGSQSTSGRPPSGYVIDDNVDTEPEEIGLDTPITITRTTRTTTTRYITNTPSPAAAGAGGSITPN